MAFESLATNLVNLRGIAESVAINVGFALVEMGGLALIVVVAIAGGDAVSAARVAILVAVGAAVTRSCRIVS